MFRRYPWELFLQRRQHGDRTLQQAFVEILLGNQEVEHSAIIELHAGRIVAIQLEQIHIVRILLPDICEKRIAEQFQPVSVSLALPETYLQSRLRQRLVVIIHNDASLESLHVDGLGVFHYDRALWPFTQAQMDR